MQENKIKRYRGIAVLIVFTTLNPELVSAQTPVEALTPLSGYSQDQVVDYPAAFFGLYKPTTALDMVKQVPGFQLEDGVDTRGYGAAGGNILIDGRRPGAKEDTPSAILGRIPSGQVDHIQLIRGQVRGVDLRGHAVVANVLLRNDIPATVRWETGVRKNMQVDKLKLNGNVSISDNWQAIDYNAGLNLERGATGEEGHKNILDGNGILLETRNESSVELGYKAGFNLNANRWLGHSRVQLNSRFGYSSEEEPLDSSRMPQLASRQTRNDLFFDDRKKLEYELGMNVERTLQEELQGKLILLYIQEDNEVYSTEQRLDAAGAELLFRSADSDKKSREGIARLELNWSGLNGHVVQLNIEGAYNSLDSDLFQSEDSGAGNVVVVIPGGNTLVEERRGDFLLRDTWSPGHHLELDIGLGAEVSTITQSGDENQERGFSYLKPYTDISYTPQQDRQTRARFAREVAQLDFEDFVSATVFQDDDLALGNPNLRPHTSWVAELSHERRFGRDSVVKLTLFHHWISDVLDLLPLTPTAEAPGNIGEGKRWGVKAEATLPLAELGLTGAKLDLKYRWQDSTVIDPVTGLPRDLSGKKGFGGTPYISYDNENRYAFIVDYRQDFEQARVAWGVNLGTRAERVLYKVNELDVYDEGIAVNVFIETTRWMGVKLRLIGENLSNLRQQRERTIYTGERGLYPVGLRESGQGREGIRLTLAMSGGF